MSYDSIKFISLTAATEMVALYSLKHSVQTGDQRFLYLGMASYAACGFWLYKSLSTEHLGTANSLWNALSNIYGLAIGAFLGDSLTFNEKSGIGAATISSLLLINK